MTTSNYPTTKYAFTSSCLSLVLLRVFVNSLNRSTLNCVAMIAMCEILLKVQFMGIQQDNMAMAKPCFETPEYVYHGGRTCNAHPLV